MAEEAGTTRVGQEGLAEAEAQNKTGPVEVVPEEALRSRTQDKAVEVLEALVAYHRWADHHHACDRSIESAGQTWVEAQTEWERKGSS